MERKYKFFIKNFALNITESEHFSADFDDAFINQILSLILYQSLSSDKEVRLHPSVGLSQRIFDEIEVIQAAGGFVLNDQAALLMIYRRGFWDLPKGKLEKGENLEECAIREVEEECGVSGLQIQSNEFRTYHAYTERNGETVIKESVWYKMKTNDTNPLIPQAEEDIEQAEWVSRPVAQARLEQCYSSIRDVIAHFD